MLSIIMLLSPMLGGMDKVYASNVYSKGFDGTDSMYNDPEQYLVYTKIDKYYYYLERGRYDNYDTGNLIYKGEVERLSTNDHWVHAGEGDSNRPFKKYLLGKGLSQSGHRKSESGSANLEIHVCSISSAVRFVNKEFGQSFSEADFEWFEYYLGSNYTNCHSYMSNRYLATRMDTTIHELTVRGIRYYYITEAYSDIKGGPYGFEKYYPEFNDTTWYWVDALCIVGDYLCEIQYMFTPGAYKITDAKSAMELLGEFTFFPEYEHGLASCRTPDIKGTYLGMDTGNGPVTPGSTPAQPSSESPTDSSSKPTNGDDVLDKILPESGMTVSSFTESCPKLNFNFKEAYEVESLDFSSGNIYLMKKGDSDTAQASDEIAFYWDLAGKTRKQMNGTMTARDHWAQWRLPSDMLADPHQRHADEVGFEPGNTYYLRVDPGVIKFKGTDAVFSMGQPGQPLEWTITLKEKEIPAEHLEGDFRFASTENFNGKVFREGMADFTYDSGWFTSGKGTVFNTHLARLSMDMAIAASANISSDYNGDAGHYIRDFFKRLKFEDIFVNQDYSVQTEDHSIGVAIASKKLEDKSTLIAVAIRGGNYGNEWGGNFTVGTDTVDHQGFSIAAKKVMTSLCNYIANKEITGNVKFWLAGYSRASAVCNLTAAELDRSVSVNESNRLEPSVLSEQIGSEIYFETDDVFAYCFEVPASTTSSDHASSKYNNIFSIVNPTDPVPRVPLAQWEFTRYGKVVFIPAPGQSEYTAYVDRMRNHFSDLYEVDLKHTDLPDVLQAPGLNKLMSDLYSAVPNREKYVSEYQMFLIEGSHDLAYATPFLSDLSLAWVGLMLTPELLRMDKFPIGKPKLLETAVPYLLTNITNLMLPHYLEYTLAWMEALEGTGVLEASMELSTNYRSSNYYRLMVKIKCPVEVTVIDEEGQIEASIAKDDNVFQADDTLISLMKTEDGGVLLFLPEDRDLDLNIHAYDEGSMQISVERYNVMTGETDRVMQYFDLPLKQNDLYQMDLYTGLEDKEFETVLLDPNGKEINADSDCSLENIPMVSVDTSVSGNGFISGNGKYVSGDHVTLMASPLEGEKFLGWYASDGALVSAETFLVLRPEEDTLLEARFTVDGASSFNEPESSAPRPTRTPIQPNSGQNSSKNASNKAPLLLFIIIGVLIAAGSTVAFVVIKKNKNSKKE